MSFVQRNRLASLRKQRIRRGWRSNVLAPAVGASGAHMFRRSAWFVAKILGCQPADLPAEQPTTFDLIINQRPQRLSD